MNFHFGNKKLSYLFGIVGLLVSLSLLLAIGGSQSIVASLGVFLFKSFNFMAFYLPFFFMLYAYVLYEGMLNRKRTILFTLSVIPFITIALLFRILLDYEGSKLAEFFVINYGKSKSLFFLTVLSIGELFLLCFIPRIFTYKNPAELDYSPKEEDAFEEYALKFPDPEENSFSKEEDSEKPIDEIFTSILSENAEGASPPSPPPYIEPIKDDDFLNPYVENDPAIAALTGDDDDMEREELADKFMDFGDYPYYENGDDEESDEASEKITEIIADLDNALSDQATEDNNLMPQGEGEDKEQHESIPSIPSIPSTPSTPSMVDELDELNTLRDEMPRDLEPQEAYTEPPRREAIPRKPYSVPIKGILKDYPDDFYREIDEDTRKSARVLEITLEEFKISAKVTGIKKGPVITMFELLPAAGVKISKITTLADNLALRLAASRVRIVAPIPGKHAVGIEVPNKKRGIVSFSEMIATDEMKDHDLAVPIVLGKDIRGGAQVIDLARTPHLLIAGATGSGKSVCVNSLICSILYERSPADVKMILIDPKIVELKLYNDIPHLLTSVITDPKKAIQAIQWCLYEMERRYSLLDSLGVREIRSYNRRVKERELATMELPYLVLVIDEFADLMATSGKELEAMIARLAAMSRAVGIHLVLATQRPSADVITGLIKANFPSRIAFMVASMMDSRIIIDSAGAEKLLGKGDMLFTSAWDPFPSRVQGAFMSEEEVERVVAYVKTLGSPEYIDDEIFIDDDENDDPSSFDGGTDPLFNKALEIVSSARKASASYLQRRLKIGYNRAARLVEQMEERGIVGPQNGSKPREVLHVSDSTQY